MGAGVGRLKPARHCQIAARWKAGAMHQAAEELAGLRAGVWGLHVVTLREHPGEPETG